METHKDNKNRLLLKSRHGNKDCFVTTTFDRSNTITSVYIYGQILVLANDGSRQLFATKYSNDSVKMTLTLRGGYSCSKVFKVDQYYDYVTPEMFIEKFNEYVQLYEKPR